MYKTWLTIGMLLCSSLASATSFDCNKVETPTEEAICTNAELSKFDDELGKAYAKALSGDNDKVQFVRDSQRGWINDKRNQCGNNVDCLSAGYKARIIALQGLGAPESAGLDFIFDNSANQYRFAVHFYRHCTLSKSPYNGECDAPARLTITAKDDSRAPQVIYLDRLLLPFLKDGKTLANSNVFYDENGMIHVDDFNFDGIEDFAVQTGQDAPYDHASFAVFLNIDGKFVFSKEFSELAQQGTNFFEVNHALKVLTTTSRIGCCGHRLSHYHVIDNKPVEFEHTIGKGHDPHYEYTERLIDGQWKYVAPQ